MFLLPKGNPLAENVPIAKLQLPEALDKLKNGRLTGCARFDFAAADCALVYEDGKMISAIVHRDGKELLDEPALQALVDLMVLASSGSFSVYGFSRELTLALLGLINGSTRIAAQEIKQIDFKSLLDQIKSDQITGTLKIYTAERAGLIFYKGGATVGFFHDAANAIESAAGEVQLIAALPEAKVDLRILPDADELKLDLTGRVDIRSLWQSASGNIFAAAAPTAPSPPPASTISTVATTSPADVEATIIELANRYVGKLGKTLAEKELMNVGGIKTLKEEKTLMEFLGALEKGSKLLASANKIKEMNEAIINEAAKL